jgi:hypothetical protein
VNIYFIISFASYIFGEIMFRSFTIVLLAFTILSANFSRLFVFAGFELNRDYIAAELCVNKAKPELNCKGRCFLAEKLKKAQEKEKKQEKELQKSCFQEASIASNKGFFFQTELLDIINTEAIVPSLAKRSVFIFHPPQA